MTFFYLHNYTDTTYDTYDIELLRTFQTKILIKMVDVTLTSDSFRLEKLDSVPSLLTSNNLTRKS